MKKLGLKNFSHVFCDYKQTYLLSQLKVFMLSPLMIPSEEAHGRVDLVSFLEIEGALKSFKKDKSLGLDGWHVEFFLHFFELVGKDLLSVVDYAKNFGHITPSINSTFLDLIPKKDKPVSFVNFRPISLCNLV